MLALLKMVQYVKTCYSILDLHVLIFLSCVFSNTVYSFIVLQTFCKQLSESVKEVTAYFFWNEQQN